MTDAGGGPGKSPCHADRKHAVGHQRMPHATEAGDDHDHDGRHRQSAGPDHRLLARAHLVVFHHRQPGEADRGAGVPLSHAGDDPPQFVGGRRRPGEPPLLLREPQQHEAKPTVLGEQVFARQVAKRRERFRHARPRGDIVASPRVACGTGIDADDEALHIPFERRRRQLLAWVLWLRPGDHLPRQAADHGADFELRPAAVEHRLHAFDEPVDRLQVGRREVVQPLGADPGEIDLVEDRAKQRLLATDLARNLLEHRNHAVSRFPLNHDHGIVVLAKLADVVDPEFVVVALGIEQIDAAHLVTQVSGREEPRGCRRQHREHHHGPGIPQADPRPADEQPAEQPWAMGRRTGRAACTAGFGAFA